jgi:predicted RNA-binding protein YlqC (UPF0109 family)
MDSDKAFLEYVVKALVDNPNDVKIDRTVDEMGVLITLTVNPADMGKIIGRMGNTAKAIRTLLRIIGMKNNARVNLKINEPEGGTGGHGGQGGMGGGMHHDDDGHGEIPTMGNTNSGLGKAPSTLKSVDEAMEELKGI